MASLADSAARGSRTRRRTMARRSRSLGPAQRECDGTRERRRDGRPSVRMVLLKELAPLGLRRFLYELRLAQGRASSRPRGEPRPCCTGTSSVGKSASKDPSCAPRRRKRCLFREPARPSQINAWSSEQSRPLATPAALEERAAKSRRQTTRPAEGLPRPDFWGGFRLWFDAVELWVEGRDRFHERVRYERPLDARDAHSSSPAAGTGSVCNLSDCDYA